MSTIPIVALDVWEQETALKIVDQLGESCRFYKIGSELFTACGPSVVREVQARGAQIFLDLKYHDIPNTVAGAVRRAAGLGVRLLTVHASGGLEMVRAAADAAGDPRQCAVLAVTVLTSLDAASVADSWGRAGPVHIAEEVLRLADVAQRASAAGVVCGGKEAAGVKARFGSALSVLIPGIRMAGGVSHDQARVSTPADAVAAGADYVVVGRAITAAPDRRAAMSEVLAQLA
jgi:orotidine-5'-phosphate decarboxylase